MPITSLTTAKIDLPQDKHDEIFFDDTVTGFGLRVRRRPGDGKIVRAWIVRYRANGRQRRYNIGNAEVVSPGQAREHARKLLAKVKLGGDPQAEKHERREKDSLSLRSVVSDYLAHKTGVKPNTLRMLRAYLDGSTYLGSLQAMPVDRITRKDIATRLLAVSKASGAPTASAFRGAMSTMFSWAMTMGLIEQNPVVNSFKPPRPPSRDRVLTDAELATIWKGVGDDEYGKVVKLLILTGCRREEIGAMRWSEFDDSTWTLPPSRSKNGKPHTLPLTDLMQKVIDTIPRREGTDLLFGLKHGFTSWSIGKPVLDKKLGLAPWVLHDIRRSVATGMANIGIQPHIIEQVLNHVSGHKRGVAGIYNKSVYEREVRDAVLRWSDHVRALVEGGRKVLAYKPKRAMRAPETV
jgi:integrase